MTAKFFAILTHQGAAKLANATALGTKLDLTQLVVGDGGGTLPTPDPAQTKLKGEKRRAAINMLSVDPANPHQIIAEQVIPENEGGWWIREIGLFDKDGTLIAIANCPETYKPQLQEGSGRTQTIRMVLIVSSTEAVTLKIDPAVVLATRDYIDNAITAHAQSRNHPDASTSAKGFVQLSSATNSTSEALAATPKAIKEVSDKSVKLSQNLADIPDKAVARNNLGLGAVAVKNAAGIKGDVLLVGDFGLGVTATHKDVAMTRKAEIYRVTGAASDAPTSSGPSGIISLPQDGTPNTGYLAVSSDGRAWVGEAATQATGVVWEQLYSSRHKPSTDDIGALARADFPAGIPQPWPTAAAPTGWLKCNGAAFDKAKYPLLAVAYPSGKLPDLRGEFIRGADDGRGIDNGRAVLSTQADAVQKFTGKTNGIQHFTPGLTPQGIISQGETVASTSGLTETTGSTGNGVFRINIDASLQIRTATETRPRNIAFNYIVRAA